MGTAGDPMISAHIGRDELESLGDEGFLIRPSRVGGYSALIVASTGERGALYGSFHLLRLMQTHQAITAVRDRPVNRLRVVDHWDNLDGSVERGFAGNSIFDWASLPAVSQRYVDYARALASLGINGTVVNNVNADPQFLSDELIRGLAGLAAVLRRWGLRLYLSANFACPISLGGLSTADPLDTAVRKWWADKAGAIYSAIPDFGGWLVKADSEGQPGPLTYGRTHAQGANMMAEALQPHGGIVMWRAFVNDFDSQTWASRAYEMFHPLDGQFMDNVVLQVKNGPIDFQVREPAHPLFGALPATNTMAELEITQEYTGQATDVCYLPQMWKVVLDFDTQAAGSGTTVARVIDGSAFDRPWGGAAGVINFGDDRDWTGHQLAAANTHGFGRLAWNPGFEPADLAEEWVRMTFGSRPPVLQLLTGILLQSWETFENYTSPLGVGFMIAGDHFTPSPQTNTAWHQSDSEGTGFDRTVATGTGYTGLYAAPVAATFESLTDCPDELLLFMHHVPYSHRLHSGKTVIQHIYDSHFDGLEQAERFRQQWNALGKSIDGQRRAAIADRFTAQVAHATQWRDTLVAYYFKTARILDQNRSWAQVISFEPDPLLLLGGWPSLLTIEAGNASAGALSVTAGIDDPAGWQSGRDSIELPARELGTLSIPVTPDLIPQITTLSLDVDAGGLMILGKRADVVVTTAGSRCLLALDAGPASGPVLAGYQALTPDDAWDPARGYGWIGGAPQSRDRVSLDDLRRDFVNDTVPRTLRLHVPAGRHDCYALTGDTNDAWPTTITAAGQQLAESEFLLGGTFAWLHFGLDGGSGGRDVDLELSGATGQHWHLGALVIPDPDSELPPAAITGAATDDLLIAGLPHPVSITVANTSSTDPVEVTARVAVPDGWAAPDVTATLAPGARDQIAVDVTAGPDPVLTTLTASIAVGGEQAGDGVALPVIAVPPGSALSLALDAGTPTSPLLDGYQRLSPDDAWDPARGYGWVGAAPQSRDRARLDVLRSDFVN
ncbi:MAG TPA: alpha-glucuronidase family glycosyl hydrolase, partial [Mycobacteriales bacterium]|nr:alpha-glucuronidase family glycosyl hydrolase [Mycobacteriales bacterium]